MFYPTAEPGPQRVDSRMAGGEFDGVPIHRRPRGRGAHRGVELTKAGCLSASSTGRRNNPQRNAPRAACPRWISTASRLRIANPALQVARPTKVKWTV
jgi:hypothetical protein